MLGEALVEPGILDDVQVGGEKGVATETQRPGNLGEREPDP